MTTSAVTAAIGPRGIATLTFNRPEKGNAYNQAMLEALFAAVTAYGADPAVRVLVLRGNGKHFCAGAEIGGHDSAAPEPRVTLPGFLRVLDECPKPTIALIHGGCIGGGLAFAACCDVALAARESFFSLPEVRIGFAPMPLVPFLVRAINPRSLRRYLVSGERFDAAEAQRNGLVHELYDAPAAEQALAAVVDGFLQAGPNAAAAAKRVLRAQSAGVIGDEMLSDLQRQFRAGFESDEAAEGRASFREKRKPKWATGGA